MSQKSWPRDRARQIMRDARHRYGRGWEMLSEQQQQNYLEAEVLRLLLTQEGEQFKVAQELAISVIDALKNVPTP